MWRNPNQYKFGAEDYLVYNQKASLSYFLGAQDKETASYNSGPVPTGAAALATIAQPVIISIWPALSFTQDEMPLMTVQSQVPEGSVSTSNAGPVQPTILDQLNSIMRSIAQQQQ